MLQNLYTSLLRMKKRGIFLYVLKPTMRAPSVFKYINNKKFLVAAVVIFFIPFIIFSFWSFPAADDYMILDKSHLFGFWKLQSWVYHTWTGRYFSTFVSAAFSYNGFLYSHYYLHSILLLSCTFLAWLFTLSQLNRFVLSHHFTPLTLALISSFLLIAEINVIPEPVTAFYWFSSAVTYQLPLILLVLLIGILIRLFNNDTYKRLNFLVACLLIVLFNGCNELITLFVLISSTWLLGICFYNTKKIPPLVSSLYILNVVSAGFLLFAPGIIYRGSLINTSPLLTIVSIAVIKFILLNWFFLKEPLWWFLIAFISFYLYNHQQLVQPLFKSLKSISFTTLLLFYVVTGMFVYLPILYVSNGSIPLRTENIFCFICSIMLIVIIAKAMSNRSKLISNSTTVFYKYRYLLFSLLIFSSANMKKVTDTLLSGYFYKQVMQERLRLFEDAKSKQQHEVTFDDYATSVTKQVKEHYSFLDRKILKDIISIPPPIICFENDLYDINYMKELYGIKKLNVLVR